MYNVEMKFKNYEFYEEKSNYYVGSVFYNNKLFEKENMQKCFSEKTDINSIAENLFNVSGYFSFVQINEGFLIAAVDHIRSYPLFYAVNCGRFYISDNAQWIKDKIGNISMDEESKIEFKIAGYVTGQDTLYAEIKQLQAGELLRVDLKNELTLESIVTFRYLTYNLNIAKENNTLEKNKEELLEELDSIVTKSMKRLIKWANGRKIIVPLSAGYDSRLIVLKLKELGYENVMTFTYGKNENKEVKISKEVARKLGFEWTRVTYTKELWKGLYNSTEKEKYFQYAHNLVSVPHIQDFLAVFIMNKQNKIPKDSVFVPGHISCFLIDSNFQKSIENIDHQAYTLMDVIFKRHYNLWDYEDENNIVREKIKKTLKNVNEKEDNYLSLYNNWEWQERQTKLIVNSIRVYDFYNYQWWLPLWDVELIKFWKEAPLEHRINKNLYIEYVVNQYSKLTGLSKNDSNKTERIKFVVTIKKLIRRSNLSYLKKIYFKLKNIKEYNHFFEWYGIMTKKKFKKHFTGQQNINSFISKDILEKKD